jgi:hypothetical protein
MNCQMASAQPMRDQRQEVHQWTTTIAPMSFIIRKEIFLISSIFTFFRRPRMISSFESEESSLSFTWFLITFWQIRNHCRNDISMLFNGGFVSN